MILDVEIGTYSLKLDQYAKGIKSYTGIDTLENKKWQQLNQKKIQILILKLKHI